jgi:enoyl-CoA hydratase/carnithine racemase
MPPITRLGRTMSLMQARVSTQWRRSTKRLRDRRRHRAAAPPATGVTVESASKGVLELRLSNGERRNVLGRSTIDRIESLVADPPSGTKVIVITAEPPDFCAGYDLLEASRGEPEQLIAHEDNFAPLRRSSIPIIVALQGNVIGGGLELALSADLRIASPETRFSIPAAKIGLVYSESGIRLVVDSVGESMARALFLGGRDLSCGAAVAVGVVAEVVGREQLRERALELGAQIASWSDVASSGNRRILDVIMGRTSDDVEALHLSSFAADGDLARSIADFVERRSKGVKRIAN